MKHRYQILAGLALATVPASGVGEPYPSKAIRLIVPNAPAGLADISARLIAAKLATTLGQPVVVDNRVGAGSTLGTAMAVRAAPDGYTLLAVFDSHATNPHLFRNIEYHTLTDLAPISLLVRGPLLLAVHPKLEVKTVQDLVKLAQTRPGAINFATVGPGLPARLLMELLKLEARVDVTNVPYKGAAGAVNDLIAGQVDAMFATVPTLIPHVKTGRLLAIAITSEKRSPAVPGVATMSETYPGFKAESWVGLLAPARTPREIVRKLNAEVTRILAMPDVRERFQAQGVEPVGSTPEQFGEHIRSQMSKWAKVVKDAGVTAE